MKVSIALNGAGINILNIPGNSGTVIGGDGKYYFLNAASLVVWMKKTFGDPDHGITHLKLDYNEIFSFDVQELLGNKKGIFIVKFEKGSLPSGYVDIYTSERCSAGLDCNVQNNSVEINLWILN